MQNLQNIDPDKLAVILAAYGIVIGAALFIGLAISAFICWLVYRCYEQVPEKHRAMTPGQVWLQIIPCFSLFWNFKVFQGLSKSYKSYFDSVKDTSVGDCYAQVALWYCIASLCCIIPCVNYIAGPASLVLLIVYLVRAYDLKAKIKA